MTKIKKLDDSKVDEIIKKSEKLHRSYSLAETKKETAGTSPEIKNPLKIKLTQKSAGVIVVLFLLALSLIQSIELLNLRKQIKSGQFGAGNGNAAGNTQGLPSQQGGC